ncbi:MAG TPA: lipopolysaccharide transport periplasmic protein LptA [Rhodanobacteraceae bacterium]|nr:lipopolysaccharide transport periplasmic protein LptA [Rhodanobacteraceae bacterium]
MRAAIGGVLAAAALMPIAASALSTDRQQKMYINADYSKIVQNSDNSKPNQPSVAYLNGNVTMDQGSLKARGDDATIYQHPSGAKNAQGEDVSSQLQRVILIGKKKQAHIEQKQDAGGLMTGDADKIDYDADTSIAVLTGNVVVVQPGRGEFRGAYMTYNTNTGEMESGDKNSSASRVQMVIEPKAKPATPAKTDAKPSDEKKPDDKKPDDKPAASEQP